MRMNIGTIIMEKRKAKKITQQELADFIGVSKASVSKWETNQTYPDITLLPLLAAYFDISIDSLMAYEPQLSHQEIQRIYESLKLSFKTKPAEEVLASIRSFVRRYYSCYPFVLQMGLLLLNHMDLLPGADNPDKLNNYILEAQQLFVHVRENASDSEQIIDATKMEAYTLLILQDNEGVLSLLGEYVQPAFPVESLIAAAFQQMGERGRAIETSQSALFQYIAIVMNLFTNYLQWLINVPEKFQQTVEKGQGLAEIFDLKQLHPIILLNFQASALVGYAYQKKDAAVLTTLSEFVELLEQTEFPVSFHGDAYFDKLESWFEQLETGNQMPRDTMMLKKDFINLVVNHPLLQAYQQNEAYQQLVQRLEVLHEEDSHE